MFEFAVFLLLLTSLILVFTLLFVKTHRNILLVLSFILYSLATLFCVFIIMGTPVDMEHRITKMLYNAEKMTVHYYLLEDKKYVYLFVTLSDRKSPMYVKIDWSDKIVEKLSKMSQESKGKKKSGNPTNNNDVMDGEKIEITNPFGSDSLEDRLNDFKHQEINKGSLPQKN